MTSSTKQAFDAYIDLTRKQREGALAPQEEEPSISEALATLYNNQNNKRTSEEVQSDVGIPLSQQIVEESTEPVEEIDEELEEAYNNPKYVAPAKTRLRYPRTKVRGIPLGGPALPDFGSGKGYSISSLENNADFNRVADRFFESIGKDEDIVEYLRDSDWNVGSAGTRMLEMKGWDQQTKEDYIWLKDKFDRAEVTGAGEFFEAFWDIGIDLVRDPVNLLTLFTAPASLGGSFAARAGMQQAMKEATKRLSLSLVKDPKTKKKLTKQVYKNAFKEELKGNYWNALGKPAVFGVAEGAAFTGPHDYFLQGQEQHLGLRENIDATRVALSAGIGGVLGGAVGGAIGTKTALGPYYSRMMKEYSDEARIIRQVKEQKNVVFAQETLQRLSSEGLDRLQSLYPEGSLIKPQVKLVETTPEGKAWAFYNKKDNVITINTKELEKKYADKAWTKPKVEGVDPLPEDSFKTLEEFRDFVLYHESSHSYMKRGAKESLAEYENRTNQYALQMLRGEVPELKLKDITDQMDLDLRQQKATQIIREDFVEENEILNWLINRTDDIKGYASKAGQPFRKAIGYTIGRSTSVVMDYANNSPTLQKFLEDIRYDWYKRITKDVVEGVDIQAEGGTFAEIWNMFRSPWQYSLQKSMQNVSRAGRQKGKGFWRNAENILTDKLDPNKQGIVVGLALRIKKQTDANNVSYLGDIDTRVTQKIKGKDVTVMEPITGKEIQYVGDEGVNKTILFDDIDTDLIDAAMQLQDLSNTMFNVLVAEGVLLPTQKVLNYFPRKFQHDKIIADRANFEKIIMDSPHADPLSSASYQAGYVGLADAYSPEQFRHLIDPKTNKPFQKISEARRDVSIPSQVNTLEELYDFAYSGKLDKSGLFPTTLKEQKNVFLTADSMTRDQIVFGRDFVQEAMQKNGIKSPEELLKLRETNTELYDAIWLDAKELKATKIVDDMLSYADDPFLNPMYLETINYGQWNAAPASSVLFKAKPGAGFQKSRVFQHIDDSQFAPYIDNDIMRVMSDYINSSSRSIARTRKFGKGPEDFKDNVLLKIRNELRENGVDITESNKVVKYVEKMYGEMTGVDTYKRWTGAWGHISDSLKLSQQLAHLPLATISSLTEPFLLAGRVEWKDYPQAGKDFFNAMGKGIKKDMERWGRAWKKDKGEDVKGFKDIDDAVWEEAYKTGLAMEQAVFQRLEGLYGEAPSSNLAKTIQNTFFQANLLTQWTGAVQLAAFTTGKRMILESSERLYNHATGIAKLTDEQLKLETKKLWEAGIDDRKAMAWYKNSLDANGNFSEALAKSDKQVKGQLAVTGKWKRRSDESAIERGDLSTKSKKRGWESTNLSFYENHYVRGATRFAKEIILNPSTVEANRPLWYGSPAGTLLTQFAGYPTAFNNTVLKRVATEVYQNPVQATPQIVAMMTMMTGVATMMNALRSQGRSLEDEPEQIALKAVQRWGGLGPFEYLYRYNVNAGYGSGQMGALLKAPAGPIVQDVVDSVLYRKGIGQTVAANLPLSAAYPMVMDEEARQQIKDYGKAFDKATWGRVFGPEKKPKKPKKGDPSPYARKSFRSAYKRKTYATGGEVTDSDQDYVNFFTRELRHEAPVLNDGAIIPEYAEEELKDFSKGITETVYRKLDSDLDAEHVEDFIITNKVGVHAHTKDNGQVPFKVRLNNPLDLRARKVEDFKGVEFMEELKSRKELQNTIIKHSKFPKVLAQGRVEEVIDDYNFILREMSRHFPVENNARVKLAMDVKFSRDLRNLFNELGYDSIIYNNEGEKSVVLFEPGQTRKLSASPQNETEMSREKYFAGGAILAALLRNRNKEERKVRTVERGDTLSEIAEEEKVDINRLIKENSIKDPNKITRGQRLFIPTGETRKEPLIPTNIRQFAYDIFGGKEPLTEKKLQTDELNALRAIVKENVSKGRMNIGYDDYKTEDSGRSDIAQKGRESMGNLEFIDKLSNPYYSLKTTLGKSSIQVKDDNVYVIDQYDFSDPDDAPDSDRKFIPDAYRAGTDIYRQMRNIGRHFGSDTGEGSPVRINLGNRKDFGI